jgi:peptide/nickel transport system substrate-binding protein
MSPNSASKHGLSNFGGYSNATVDALAQRAQEELDRAKRTSLLQQALSVAQEDVATIPLHNQHQIWASAPNVELTQTPLGRFYLYWVRMK